MSQDKKMAARSSVTGTPTDSSNAEVALGTFVTLKRYCEITGDTTYAVHNRRRRGVWVDGVHCHVKSRRRLWVNVVAANQWIMGAI
jgi:hypothetical protein